MTGYFGNPESEHGKCESCNCNTDGIVSDECDEVTGQCNCKSGVIGKMCDKCEAERHVLQNQKCRLCDNCTLTLLDKVDEIELYLNFEAGYLGNMTVTAPWETLDKYEESVDDLGNMLRRGQHDTRTLFDRYSITRMDKMKTRARNMQIKTQKMRIKAEKRTLDTDGLQNKTDQFISDLMQTCESLRNTIDNLNQYGTSDHQVTLEGALNQATDYLNKIEDKSNDYFSNFDVQQSHDLFTEYSNITKWAKYHEKSAIAIKSDLDQLNDRLENMKSLEKKASATIEEADSLAIINLSTLDHLKNKYLMIGSLADDVTEFPYLDKAAAFEVLENQIQDNMGNIERDIGTLKSLIQEGSTILNEQADQYEDVMENKVTAASIHATDLLEKSINYKDLFKDSKLGSENALKAR